MNVAAFKIAVYASAEAMTSAQQYAQQLNLPMITQNPLYAADYDYLVHVSAYGVGLIKTQSKRAKPFYVDFTENKITYRRKEARLKNELLAKAIKLHPKEHVEIIDATAGFGRDSFLLASLGFYVTLIERNPIVFCLLADGLRRGEADPLIEPIMQRLALVQEEATTFLRKQAARQKPAVVYLDPMFPTKQKSAASKKEMQFLREIVGKEQDETALYQAAIACALSRVVIKRPRLAPFLAEKKPDYSLEGSSSRFDIYLV